MVLKPHNLELMANSVQDNDPKDNIDPEDNTEEPEELLQEFYKRFPTKPP